MELLQGETVVWRGHPSWRASLAHYVVWIPLALVPIVIVSLLRANDTGTGLALWQWILITIALVGLVVLVDAIRRHATTYTVTSRRIHIRRGILRRLDQSTHIDRVQNLNTRQSLLERALAVGTVDFDTAGTEADEASFSFSGISHPHRLVHTVETARSGLSVSGTEHPTGV